MSGIVLVGIAIYLNLSMRDVPVMNDDGGHFLEATPNNDFYTPDDDLRSLGQAILVDNMNVDNVTMLPDEVPEDNYFAVSVINRQRARDEALHLLQSVIETSDNVPAAQAQALYDVIQIAIEIEREANVEALIKAKGFTECVAVISGEIANIIVKTEGLMPNEVAQIKEIVFEQAGILPMNIKIIERN